MTEPVGFGQRSEQSRANFDILDQIGQGGSSTVYRAHNSTFNGIVALKVWNQIPTDDQRRRFFDECSLQWQLSGEPNIVRLYWADAPAGEQPWLATELYDSSLAERLRADVPPAAADAYRWAEDILVGLTAIHSAGHLHRDVKPANVLIKDGRAALADLGIAMEVDAFTADNSAGTPFFVAPELSRGEPPTLQSDVFSAAVTINRLLPGPQPAEIEALLERALSFHPGDRPVDGADFLARFRTAAADAGVAPTNPVESRPVAPLSAPNRRRGPLLAVAAAVAAVAVTVTLVAAGWNSRPAAEGETSDPSVVRSNAPVDGVASSTALITSDPSPAAPVAEGGLDVSAAPSTVVLYETAPGGAVSTMTTTYAGQTTFRTNHSTTTVLAPATSSTPSSTATPPAAPATSRAADPLPNPPAAPTAPAIEVLPTSSTATSTPVPPPPVTSDPVPPTCQATPTISAVPAETADPAFDFVVDAPCAPTAGVYRVMVTELEIDSGTPHSEYYLQTKGDWNIEQPVSARTISADVSTNGVGLHRKYFIAELTPEQRSQLATFTRTTNRAGYQGAQADALFDATVVSNVAPNVWVGAPESNTETSATG